MKAVRCSLLAVRRGSGLELVGGIDRRRFVGAFGQAEGNRKRFRDRHGVSLLRGGNVTVLLIERGQGEIRLVGQAGGDQALDALGCRLVVEDGREEAVFTVDYLVAGA